MEDATSESNVRHALYTRMCSVKANSLRMMAVRDIFLDRAHPLLRHNWASAFLQHSGSITMQHPTPLAGLSYSNCTARELNEFVRARGGTAFPSNNKNQLRHKLRQLDEDWRFPNFFGLASELRNMIYREVVRKDPDTRIISNWSIVLTDRLVHQESIAMLYDMRTLEFVVGDRRGFSFQGKVLFKPRSPLSPLAYEWKGLPRTTLLRARHLDIQIPVVTRSNAIQVNRELLALANMLGDNTVLNTVHVRLGNTDDYRELSKLCDVLYPLVKLLDVDVEVGSGERERTTIDLHDFDDALETRLHRFMDEDTVFPVDAIGILLLLHEHAQELESLMEQYPPVDPIFDLFLCATEGEMLSGVVGPDSDERFCRKMRSLQQVFLTNGDRWITFILANKLAAMNPARTNLEEESVERSNLWIGDQGAMFKALSGGT